MSLGAAGRPSYLDLVRDRVVVFDGAMGTSIQNYNLDEAGYGGIEGCNEYLVLHNPGLIEEVHASFLEVGVDVIETDTFGGSQLKLAEYAIPALISRDTWPAPSAQRDCSRHLKIRSWEITASETWSSSLSTRSVGWRTVAAIFSSSRRHRTSSS